MRVFILTLLLTVLTSFTTVTLAVPSIDSKGLVIATIGDTATAFHFEKVTTDQLKIEPIWFIRELTNYKAVIEIPDTLHIDPGRKPEEFYISNTLKGKTNTILHIDPGQEFNRYSIYNTRKETTNTEILHIDPGRN